MDIWFLVGANSLGKKDRAEHQPVPTRSSWACYFRNVTYSEGTSEWSAPISHVIGSFVGQGPNDMMLCPPAGVESEKQKKLERNCYGSVSSKKRAGLWTNVATWNYCRSFTPLFHTHRHPRSYTCNIWETNNDSAETCVELVQTWMSMLGPEFSIWNKADILHGCPYECTNMCTMLTSRMWQLVMVDVIMGATATCFPNNLECCGEVLSECLCRTLNYWKLV